MYDHVYAVCNGKTKTLISVHMGFKHKNNISMMAFVGLESIRKNPRGGNWDQAILRLNGYNY